MIYYYALIGNKRILNPVVNWCDHMLWWVTHTWLSSLTQAQVLNPSSHHSPQFDAGPGFEQARIDSLPISAAQQSIDTAFRRPLRGESSLFDGFHINEWRHYGDVTATDPYCCIQWSTDGLQRGCFLNLWINIDQLQWHLCMKSFKIKMIS